MSAVDISARAGASYLGIESTFGSAPSVTRCFPDTGSTLVLTQANLPNNDERVRVKAHLKPVQGLKSGTATLKTKLRPDGTQLTTGASAATPWLGVALKAGLGGEASGGGSTVQTSSTTTSLIVGTGHGSRFKIGTWIGVEVSGALEWARVVNVSTDTLTLVPALSGTPTTSGVVVNSYCYFPTETNTQSLYFQHAKAQDSSASKYSLGGGLTGLKLTTQRGEYLSAEWSLQFVTWAAPTTDTVAVTTASDGMAAPVVMRNATTLLQAAATTSTKVHYPIEVLDVELPQNLAMDYVKELGGVEGNVGVMRAGECRPWTKLKLTVRADSQLKTWYDAQTTLQFVLQVPAGSGTTTRAVILDVPSCVIVAMTTPKESGGMWRQDVMLEGLEDTTTTTSGLTGTNLDCALAPFRLALL